MAGTVASKEPVQLTGLPGKEPVVATRELSGKRKEEDSHSYAEYKIEKRGEHKKRQVTRKSDSILPKNASENFAIHMRDIGDLTGRWGTQSGKELLDSIANAYAKFNMVATFEHIIVSITVVPHDMIRQRCKNPNTGELYNTEYACTVNPESMVSGVGDVLIPEYVAMKKNGAFADGKPIPCFDDESLRFEIYFSEKLTDNQRAELLVHELKHCTVLYAFIQKIVFLIARDGIADETNNFIKEMGAGGFSRINDYIGQMMDKVEQFDPEEPFCSTFPVVDEIMRLNVLHPYGGVE